MKFNQFLRIFIISSLLRPSEKRCIGFDYNLFNIVTVARDGSIKTRANKELYNVFSAFGLSRFKNEQYTPEYTLCLRVSALSLYHL